MRRSHWVVIFVLSGSFLLLAISSLRSEPNYQGRPLSSWLRGFESEVASERWQSAEAVRHIGTNALPLLVARLRHKPPVPEPHWKETLRGLLTKQSIIKISIPHPGRERREALAALDALGPVAKDAVPALEALLRENPPDPRALLVLSRLGPEAVPALTRALTNDQKIIRLGSRACLEMLPSRSEILFPKTAQDAEFTRRTSQFNAKLRQAAFLDYKAQHPEQFSEQGSAHSSDSVEKPSLIKSEHLKTPTMKKQTIMLDTPHIARTAAQPAALIHLTVPRAEILNVMGPGLTEVMAAVAAQRIAAAGPWFTHHLRMDPGVFDFEICVPVSASVAAMGRVKPGEWPAMKVARTICHGDYEGLEAAWAVFDVWIEANGHKPAPDLWERYVAGPELDRDPATWRTELSRPLIS
jgi:effector-binding domain-containing protein